MLTDFGYGLYVGEMKGVILSINPEVALVDITHEVSRHDIAEGAFLLYASYRYFPPGTVFVGVVDPGVGTARRAVAIQTSHYYFVGPDNGLLYPASSEDGIEEVVEIESGRYTMPKISRTFHGRDVFAPAAAHLSSGIPISELGPRVPVGSLVKLEFGRAEVGDRRVRGRVLFVDRFGNLITNVRPADLERAGIGIGDVLELEIGSTKVEVVYAEAYSRVPEGSLLCLVGGFDLLEISVNRGSAAEALGAERGDAFSLRVIRGSS